MDVDLIDLSSKELSAGIKEKTEEQDDDRSFIGDKQSKKLVRFDFPNGKDGSIEDDGARSTTGRSVWKRASAQSVKLDDLELEDETEDDLTEIRLELQNLADFVSAMGGGSSTRNNSSTRGRFGESQSMPGHDKEGNDGDLVAGDGNQSVGMEDDDGWTADALVQNVTESVLREQSDIGFSISNFPSKDGSTTGSAEVSSRDATSPEEGFAGLLPGYTPDNVVAGNSGRSRPSSPNQSDNTTTSTKRYQQLEIPTRGIFSEIGDLSSTTNPSRKEQTEEKTIQPSGPEEKRRHAETRDRKKPTEASMRRLSEVRPSDEIKCTCEEYEKYPAHLLKNAENKHVPTSTPETAATPGTEESPCRNKYEARDQQVDSKENNSSNKTETDLDSPSKSSASQENPRAVKKDSSSLLKLWGNFKHAALSKKPSLEEANSGSTATRDTQSLMDVPKKQAHQADVDFRRSVDNIPNKVSEFFSLLVSGSNENPPKRAEKNTTNTTKDHSASEVKRNEPEQRVSSFNADSATGLPDINTRQTENAVNEEKPGADSRSENDQEVPGGTDQAAGRKRNPAKRSDRSDRRSSSRKVKKCRGRSKSRRKRNEEDESSASETGDEEIETGAADQKDQSQLKNRSPDDAADGSKAKKSDQQGSPSPPFIAPSEGFFASIQHAITDAFSKGGLDVAKTDDSGTKSEKIVTGNGESNNQLNKPQEKRVLEKADSKGILGSFYGTIGNTLSIIFTSTTGDAEESDESQAETSEDDQKAEKPGKVTAEHLMSVGPKDTDTEESEGETSIPSKDKGAREHTAAKEATSSPDEDILRSRRVRRRMPTGIETDTFSLPYSFNQKGPAKPELDLNDDSESNGNTMPDAMFRAPPVVRYAAYTIGACMLGMVLLALQYRFLKRAWVSPEKWVPRLAITVLVTLVTALVYGYCTKADFVRRPRSGATDSKQADAKKKKDKPPASVT